MIYTFQNAATMTQIGLDLILDLNNQNPIFDYVFPITERETDKIRWYQDENDRGLMKLRGAGGAPTPISPTGRKFYETEPGIFGEYDSIDEIELRGIRFGRNAGPMSKNVSVEDRVNQSMRTLRTRYYNRLRQMAWTLARLGNLTLTLPSGGVGYQEAIVVQTRTVPILWTNLTTAVPLFDLQQQQQLYGIGSTYDYAYGSVAICNSYTANLLTNNRNAADWGGKKGQLGQTLQSLSAYDIIRMDMSLPAFVIWDKGYLNDAGVWTMDIPNGEILHVSVREDGERPGEFALTTNEINESAAIYAEVHDYTGHNGNTHNKEIPPRLEVHMGFNGGLAAHHIRQWNRLIVA